MSANAQPQNARGRGPEEDTWEDRDRIPGRCIRAWKEARGQRITREDWDTPVSEVLLMSQTYDAWTRILVKSIFSACYQVVGEDSQSMGFGSIRSTIARLRKSKERRMRSRLKSPVTDN